VGLEKVKIMEMMIIFVNELLDIISIIIMVVVVVNKEGRREKMLMMI
jgi:hypothetical protein